MHSAAGRTPVVECVPAASNRRKTAWTWRSVESGRLEWVDDNRMKKMGEEERGKKSGGLNNSAMPDVATIQQ